jgi:hypothetical protein
MPRMSGVVPSDMADDKRPTYESPVKRQIEQGLATMGKFASPRLRALVEEAVANIDHTDPKRIVELLPPEVLAFYRYTVVRAVALTPLIKHAHESGCYIESIILSHGLIQFALRGLYVLAWQRAVLPRSLSTEELKPYYRQRSREGDVFPLIEALEKNELIFDFDAEHLKSVNELRNKAAHGVIFGEIEHSALSQASDKAQYAALGALERFQAWFNNAQPLKHVPDAP